MFAALQLDIQKLSALYPLEQQRRSHIGVYHEGDPRAGVAELQPRDVGVQGDAKEHREQGAQDGDRDEGAVRHVFHVARTAQTARVDHAGVLGDDAENDHDEGKRRARDDLRFIREDGGETALGEEQAEHQSRRDHPRHAHTDLHIAHGLVLALSAQRLAHHGRARGGDAVTQTEGQGGDLRYDGVRGEGVRAETRDDAVIDKEAHAQRHALRHGGGAYLDEAAHGALVEGAQADFQMQIAVFAQHHAEGDPAAHRCTYDRGEGGSAHAQSGEAEMSADQAVVHDHVYEVGRDVCDHGDAGVARGAQGGADAQVPAVEHEAGGDHFKILHGHGVGVRVRARQLHDGAREEIAEQRDHEAHTRDQHHGLGEHGVRARPVAFTLAAGDERRRAHAQRLREDEQDHAGLARQIDGGDGVLVHALHHHRVHGADDGEQQTFQRRGPRDAESVSVHFARVRHGLLPADPADMEKFLQ